MAQNNLETSFNFSDDFCAEFEVDNTGKVFAKSLAAVARLAGITPKSLFDIKDGKEYGVFAKIKNVGRKQLPDSLKPISGFVYTPGEKIPDFIVSAIVKYYAWEAFAKNNTARSIDSAMSAVGHRTWLQHKLGYKLTEFNGRKLPQNFSESLMMLAVEVEKNEALESKILEDEPYTSLGKQIETTINGFTIGQYAKHLGRSRNKTFKELRELGFIQKFPSTLPYQHHIDRGYFKIITTIKTDRWHNQRKFAVAIVTSKGEIAIERARIKSVKKDNAIALIESAIDHELIVI
jgi:phage antirepressor YoqD-like protein